MKFHIVFACLLVHVVAFNFEEGDNSTVRGCSSHCSYQDSTLECWNKTLDFFEKVLLGQMRHYIAVQINIDQWHRRNDKHYVTNFSRVIDEANSTLQKYVNDADVLSRSVVYDVARTLIQRVANVSTGQISWIPHYSCPLPCEHFYSVWRNLFIVSVVLNIALALVVIPFAKRMARREPDESLMN
ncbi:hypothetical protein FO519_000299 [Halicephalobus sp. NKZ332]|nr:hypothetical protein FO519_000299 [Halicephalobus sp. NKZ332]